jgi:hypothetical protein
VEQLAKKWSKKQIQFQEWLARPKYARYPPNQELLADEMGVHCVTLSKWKRKPGWVEAVNDLARAGLEQSLPEVYGALIREAEKGSIHHIRTVLELVGQLGPEVTDERTQIAIVFNDKDIQAVPHRLDPDVESEAGTINLLPIQHSRLWTEVGQNGSGGGAAGYSRNGDG